MELKDKLGGADAAARILIGADAEALEALEALGYSMRDARESVAKAKGETAQEKYAMRFVRSAVIRSRYNLRFL